MSATKGVIIQIGQAIGTQKALAKMAETVARESVHPEEKMLMITHCNCRERAEKVKEMILEKIRVKRRADYGYKRRQQHVRQRRRSHRDFVVCGKEGPAKREDALSPGRRRRAGARMECVCSNKCDKEGQK